MERAFCNLLLDMFYSVDIVVHTKKFTPCWYNKGTVLYAAWGKVYSILNKM